MEDYIEELIEAQYLELDEYQEPDEYEVGQALEEISHL